MNPLQYWTENWQNDAAMNERFHKAMTEVTDTDPVLKEHRDWVEANQWGFGDRAFSAVWDFLIMEMPGTFSFLEVGVFKGQTTSLIALIAKKMVKTATVFAVTTLTNTEDVRCRYPAGDYREWITQIHNRFSVPQPTLIVGKSNDPNVLSQVAEFSPFDVIYVDAGHDYPDVVSDIQNYGPKVKVGGFLVMDDASIGRLNVGSCWSGLEDVAKAVTEHLDQDKRFKFLLACGHLNVFRRISE